MPIVNQMNPVGPPTGRIRNVDVFAVINALMCILMSVFVYYDLFLQYRGRGNVHEFFVYAIAIQIFIGILWWYLRHFVFPTWLLLLAQVGILAHFAGAFIPMNGGRLYEVLVLGIPYDKIVHFLNAFMAAALTNHVFRILDSHLPLIRNFVICLVVMGLGGLVEIVEYLVMLTVPAAGAGGYDNNMQDLIANLAGCLFFMGALFLHSLRTRSAVGIPEA